MDEDLLSPRRETLSLRQAARAHDETCTNSVLDAARRAVEDALLDRTLINASPQAYAEFLARLNAPASPNDRLRRTLDRPPAH